jgi:signal transduction histidine kinase
MDQPAVDRNGAPGKMPGLSPRLISRAGYAFMIALLVVSALEAYRIQGTLSRVTLETYRQSVKQDRLLSQLRLDVWRGSVYARDFFLNPDARRAAAFKAQLEELRRESLSGTDQLATLAIPEQSRVEVRSKLQEFWNTLDEAADSMVGVAGPDAHEFAQKEIVPRRSQASAALRQLSQTSQEVVENSAVELARSRQAAGQRILLMLGLSLVSGTLVAFFSIRRNENLERELRRRHEQTEDAKRELEQLSVRLIEVQEEERGRLSRELHDEIGQVLTALRIEVSRSLSLVGPLSPEAGQQLGRAKELAERAVRTIRNISLLLRPAALDDLGLIPALHWQVEDFSRRSGIQCDFTQEDVEDLLPGEIKTCAYRIVQETLHNCEKYSGASRIRLLIRQTVDCLLIEAEDNGIGLELAPNGMPLRRHGSGILGMRERTAIVGGSLTLTSAPGKGLQLVARIPLSDLDSRRPDAAAGTEVKG